MLDDCKPLTFAVGAVPKFLNVPVPEMLWATVFGAILVGATYVPMAINPVEVSVPLFTKLPLIICVDDNWYSPDVTVKLPNTPVVPADFTNRLVPVRASVTTLPNP